MQSAGQYHASQPVIESIVVDSTVSLFSDYHCEAESIDNRCSDMESSTAAIIDAGSDDLEISLVIKAPFSVLAMSYPVPVEQFSVVSDSDLEDWLAEIANQLIGRIKQNLIRRECYVTIGLPQTFYGDELEQDGALGEQDKVFLFSVDGEDCEVHIKTHIFNDNFQLAESVDEGADVQESGEFELF